jgi:predicted nucleotidyltransferase
MIDIITTRLPEIAFLCRQYGVLRLELFGSAATGDFDPEQSDIDFLVEYPPDYDLGPWAARHFELQERLEQLLGRRVDLVMASALRKPRFIESVNQTRQLLYAA